MFLDPSISPACHAKTLSVSCSDVVTVADAQAGGWIEGFSHVLHLKVDHLYGDGSAVSLLVFRGFSPILKSLHLNFAPLSPSQIFDFILSFPLLEDLTASLREGSVYDGDGSDGPSPAIQSSNLPRFTGSLELPGEGITPISRRLLSLPGGIHFRKLTLRLSKAEDFSLTMALVEGCSHTLESLDITYAARCTSICVWVRVSSSIMFLVELGSISFNLSKATKLRDAVFRLGSLTVEWVTMVLQAITPKHQDLEHISIYMPSYMLPPVRPGVRITHTVEGIVGQWLDLDRLLVQFSESRSIRLRVICGMLGKYEQNTKHSIGCLLPVAAGGGMIDVVE